MAGENQHSEATTQRSGNVLAEIYRSIMRDGSLAAMAREGLKDVQATVHEAAYGKSDHGHEPGAPLTPLHSDIEKAREHYAPRSTQPLSAGMDRGRDGTAEPDRGTVHGRENAPQPTTPEAAKGQGGNPQGLADSTVPGKDNVQYAQEVVFIAEEPPIPNPAPEAPAPVEGAVQGEAPRPSGLVERVESLNGQRTSGNGDGGSFVERLAAEKGQPHGEPGGGSFVERLDTKGRPQGENGDKGSFVDRLSAERGQKEGDNGGNGESFVERLAAEQAEKQGDNGNSNGGNGNGLARSLAEEQRDRGRDR